MAKKQVYAPADDMPKMTELPHVASGTDRVYRLEVESGELFMMTRPIVSTNPPMALMFVAPSKDSADITDLPTMKQFMGGKLARRVQVKDFIFHISKEMQADIDGELASLMEIAGKDNTDEETEEMSKSQSTFPTRMEHNIARLKALADEVARAAPAGESVADHLSEILDVGNALAALADNNGDKA